MCAKLKLGVLGSGSGSNMQSIQDAIMDGTLDAEIVCVIADVPNAKILERAAKYNIPAAYLDPAPFKTKLEGVAEQCYIDYLKEHGAEVVVLAGFMRIIKPGLLKAFPQRVLNIHPALLRKSELILIVLVDFELCFNIAFKVAKQVIVIGLVPACTVKKRVEKLLEIAGATV